jgi:hypothetical protein
LSGGVSSRLSPNPAQATTGTAPRPASPSALQVQSFLRGKIEHFTAEANRKNSGHTVGQLPIDQRFTTAPVDRSGFREGSQMTGQTPDSILNRS